MNAFEKYADEKGYRGLPRQAEKLAKGTSELEQKMEERGRLMKGYRAYRRQLAKDLFTAEPRLRDFRRYLKKVGAEDGEELVEAIDESWLPVADKEVRLFALRLVADRCDRIRLLLGLESPCDPLWHEEPSVFQRARVILNRSGAL